MFRILALAVLALAVAVLAPLTASAREGDWKLLGEQNVGSEADRDIVRVGRDKGLFSRLRLTVSGRDVFLTSIRVRFENGTEESFAIGREIRAGEQTPPIDLSGDARAIREIELLYRGSSRGRGRATVAVLGEEARARHADARETFTEIDRRTADRRDERIVLRTERGEGRPSAIRIQAIRGPLRLNRVDVVFANGDRQSVDVTDRLEDGQSTRPLPIDLSRDRRRVDEVVVHQRPGFRPGSIEIALQGADIRDNRDVRRDDDRDIRRDERREAMLAERGAPTGGWVLFGSQQVGFGVDRDVVKVGRDAGQFEKIALRILKNDIYLREVTVVFANGERQNVKVNVELKEGFRTAPLPLEKGDRFIDSIELVYQSKPDRRGEAIVEVWGDYSARWLQDAESRRGHAGGWVLLGAQRAEMLKNDRDSFDVGEKFGRFKAIRLTAKRRAVRVNGLRIVYGNGETEDVPVGMELRDGQTTDPIDLKGRGRFIQRIETSTRTKLNFKGEGVVEVWGLQ